MVNIYVFRGRCCLDIKEPFIGGIADFIPILDSEGDYKISYLKGYEDALDAVISGLVGFFYLEGKGTPYGNSEGAIWVPIV